MKEQPNFSDKIPQSIYWFTHTFRCIYNRFCSHPMSALFMGICTTQFISAFRSRITMQNDKRDSFKEVSAVIIDYQH